ncbi:MAG: hypothetical protein ACOCRX_12505, partial [Candidatus Woesearchaeota archaeon]
YKKIEPIIQYEINYLEQISQLFEDWHKIKTYKIKQIEKAKKAYENGYIDKKQLYKKTEEIAFSVEDKISFSD